jgi:thiosulfate/3-mercaptopyruvate sulfurtransferase
MPSGRFRSFFHKFCVEHFVAIGLTICLAAVAFSHAHAANSTDMQTITPEEMARALSSKEAKPLILNVGPHKLFVQAHIPGAEYMGAGNTPEGLQHMGHRIEKLPKNSAIVLYCGCCPWSYCPNVNPAHDALLKLGFTNVKVLYITTNFGTDWVEKGYPVAKGEQ